MRIVYIADDGTQFNDEDSCMEYEAKGKYANKIKRARFFNDDGVPMTFIGTAEQCEDCFYFEVFDLEEAQAIQDWFNDCGMDTPFYDRLRREVVLCTGRFFFDCDQNRWRNVMELYKEYTNVNDIFEKWA